MYQSSEEQQQEYICAHPGISNLEVNQWKLCHVDRKLATMTENVNLVEKPICQSHCIEAFRLSAVSSIPLIYEYIILKLIERFAGGPC